MKCAQIRSFFWSVFSRIWTKYGKIQSISPYSVRMRENIDQKKTPYMDTFHAVQDYCEVYFISFCKSEWFVEKRCPKKIEIK